MKKTVIGANWKMNKTVHETKDYFRLFLEKVDKHRGKVEIFILVPHTVLALAADLTKWSGVNVGSQNHFWEDFGPYTGEVSAAMIRDCGGEYAMIGHCERRNYFHETIYDVHRKAKAALRNQLIPIVCIGESMEEHQSGQTSTTIKTQMTTIFKDFNPGEIIRCYILYEPFWAVGAEEPASPSEAQKAHHIIREEISKRFGEDVSRKVRIIYGGAVRRDNVTEFLIQLDIDGVGVGRAGFDPLSFSKIIDVALSEKV